MVTNATQSAGDYWRRYLTAGFAEFTTPSIGYPRYHRTYRIHRWPNRPSGRLILAVRANPDGGLVRWCRIGTIGDGGWMLAPPERQPSEAAAEYVRRLIEGGDPATYRHPCTYINRDRDSAIECESDLFQTIDTLIFNVIDDKPVSITPSSVCAACGKPLLDPTSVKVGIGPCCRRRLGISAKQITRFLGRETVSK